jgi:hypothetical protein
MKKLITLLLLFTLVGFLSGNQVVITNDYEYIITTEATYNFTDGNASSNVKYDRTNKIQIQNNKVIANPLNYHYAFFWDEADSFIGYYKTNKGIATNGAYLGQINTQSIPLPLNAYSFALVRYDNNYFIVNNLTLEDIFKTANVASGLIPPMTGAGFIITPPFTLTDDSLFLATGGAVANLNISFTNNDKIYTLYEVQNGTNYAVVFRDVFRLYTPGIRRNISEIETYIVPATETRIRLFSSGGNVFIYKAFVINLTTLGIGSSTKATIDGYYAAYEDHLKYSFILPLAFNTQTISFETIYFDDGVSTEIERLGSILIFTLIGFTLMIFGFASKRRIFNLLAVGAFVVLGFLLIEFVGFIIILFGLIFVNVYYTFFGEL